MLRTCLLAIAVLATRAAADPCSPDALKLPSAKPLASWSPSTSCSLAHAGHDGHDVVHSQTELDRLFSCATGSAPHFDFTHASLVVVSWTMAAAATGLDALDDGQTLTLVTRFRKPCPGDLHPMQVNDTRFFVIPSASATRTFGTASCTLDTKC
jgi:hypothetical protein